ncbi:MAG: MBL fold metallo-hydrolase [Thermoplasmata archaeon]|nr:MBL fold metallo-hydrolase [Thermoplasmata archaeon]
MRIIWHGHSCFEVRDEISIVIDPHDGRSIGIRPPKATADLVLVTHDHFDHNAVRMVTGPGTKVVSEPGRVKRHGVRIVGIPAFHDGAAGERRGGITIFRFTVGDIDFCHLGDVGEPLDPPRLREIGAVDVLFVPAGGRFTLEPDEAWELATRIGPRVIVPMHFGVGGISLPLQPVSSFIRNADRVIDVGSEIDIVKEELPEEREVWVFSL